MAKSWTHLIRFIAREDGQVHLGQVNTEKFPDVGLATLDDEEIPVKLISGTIFDGVVTDKVVHVGSLLSPISIDEVPIIRCMGLNYADHAKEAKIPIPEVPILLIKPRTSLNGPFPAKIPVSELAQDGSSDYEAELALILGKTGRNIPEDRAWEYVLGYTASNDVSARKQQLKTPQWSFSKGFDGSCPLGPVLVSPSALGDPHALQMKAIYNGKTVQDINTSSMIFRIPKIISFLSKGTTLERGTVILTGTGPGIGIMHKPTIALRHGDDIRIEIQGIGTLINQVYYE